MLQRFEGYQFSYECAYQITVFAWWTLSATIRATRCG